MLFGVSTLDVWAFGAATSGLASAALVGCGIPARRAARQDPMVTLRLE
jgi:ABC-type lipoprotein release transport system permease subunit